MALAVLDLDDDGGAAAGIAGVSFRCQIGCNRYYVYAVGRRDEGVASEVLDPSFESRMQGPLPPAAMGRVTLEIPRDRLGREDRFVQLVSFRSPDRRGPAVSEIVEVPLFALGRRAAPLRRGGALMLSVLDRDTPLRAAVIGVPAESVPFQLRERKRSEAMFWGAIGSLISNALPAISGLLGGGAGAGGLSGIVGKLLPGLGDLLKGGSGGGLGDIVGKLLGSLTGGGDAKGGGGTANLLDEVKKLVADPKVQEMVFDFLRKTLAGGSATASSETKSLRRPRTFGYAMTRGEPLSEAQIAPALLALLPMLEKVLTPETIQAVLDQPAKLTGAVADGIAKVGNVAIDAAKVENDWIAKFNPGINDTDIISLMKGVPPGRVSALGLPAPKVGAGVSGRDLPYRRVDSVELHFTAGSTEIVNNQTRVAYLMGRDLGLELEVRTPREIPDPTLEIAIKDCDTLEAVWRTRVRPGALRAGRVPRPVVVPAAALAHLPASEDYVVTATLFWKNRAGRSIGTSRTMNLTLVGPLAFDRLGPARPPARLDDAGAYRNFWHKVWQASLGEGRRFELDCKYYVTLDPARTRNGRMESLVDLAQTARTRRAGRLKSGLLMAPDELAALAPRLGGGALSPEVREALRTSEIAERLSHAARAKVEFAPKHGGTGDSVSLWVYPEVQLQEVVFKRARDVGAGGRVLRFDEQKALVPVPVAVHFVGVSTAAGAGEPPPGRALLNGMNVVFDQRAALTPVEVDLIDRPPRVAAAGRWVPSARVN
jgi:hypothetical protein